MKCSHRKPQTCIDIWYDIQNEKGHWIWYLECKEPDRTSSLTAVAREFARYKFDLVVLHEVRWNNGDMVRAVD